MPWLNMSDFSIAMQKLSREADIAPLIALFKRDVAKRLGLRETQTFNEQAMKLMLFGYLSQTGAFYLMTEKEVAQGYCDLLGIRSRSWFGKFAWIIEAQYVESKATKARIEAGYEQVDKYASDKDLVEMLTLGRELKAGVLVFVGLKDVFFRAWPRPTKAAKSKAAKTRAALKKAASTKTAATKKVRRT